jgi:trans-2,3-dihydro-3-hydroxyanthranilate isomerase
VNNIEYSLVDVFASQPLAGNSLTVFELDRELPDTLLQAVTREMRQFETIFLWPTAERRCFRARMFTMEEELGFAGHPIIGAAGVLHTAHFAAEEVVELTLELKEKTVTVRSRRSGALHHAEMDQGTADFVTTVDREHHAEVLDALNLDAGDLLPTLPIQVVSTGLPYLIVPVQKNLAHARIVRRDFEALLARFGAKFVYVLDVPGLEGRSWDNDGKGEDIATGSAAGPAGAYLARHGIIRTGLPVVFRQGGFVGRPSHLSVTVGEGGAVRVGGGVVFVGRGDLRLP